MKADEIHTLSAGDIGKTYSVVSVHGGRGMEQRLSDMGFLPGVEVTLIEKGQSGPLVVSVKGSKLAIGFGMADKIMVRSLVLKPRHALTVALVGNPNAGKSSVFNALTGANQSVGNYPGVTIEKKEGTTRYHDYSITVIDLPGTYSLTAYSLEETVTRNFILHEKPDVVIDVVDASNLERNLYLTTQLMELNVPIVVCLNKSDLAEANGLAIDFDRLAELFGIPFVPTIGHKKKGIQELLRQTVIVGKLKHNVRHVTINYGAELEDALTSVSSAISGVSKLKEHYPLRWFAGKLLEHDRDILELCKQESGAQDLLALVEDKRVHLASVFTDKPEVLFADRRYGFISGACMESVQHNVEARHQQSDMIDKVLIHRVWGLPIFLALMWGVFQLVFALSTPLVDMIAACVDWGARIAETHLTGVWASCVADGIIRGVGGVIEFLPSILLLFLAIAFLEDSGYMARAAFVVDKLMHKIGLHGKSFVPMLLGFGCTVPAVMGTRILEDKKDRLITMLITPFMSCGARLPVYALFIGAFFPAEWGGHVLFSLYLLGIIVAILVAKVFRAVIFPGSSASFVMELPPYRFPTMKGLAIHMWMRGWHFLKKAGTVILLASLAIWFLMNFPQEKTSADMSRPHKTYAEQIGYALEPVIRPLGFNGKIGVALISGLAAKEIIVSTLIQLYVDTDSDNADESSLQAALRQDPDFSPLVAYALMVFILLYAPCLPAMAVLWKEAGHIGWAIAVILYTTGIAWIASFVIYQVGRLIGL